MGQMLRAWIKLATAIVFVGVLWVYKVLEFKGTDTWIAAQLTAILRIGFFSEGLSKHTNAGCACGEAGWRSGRLSQMSFEKTLIPDGMAGSAGVDDRHFISPVSTAWSIVFIELLFSQRCRV